MIHPFLQAIYAAARRHIKAGKDHQQWALGYASCQYMPGFQGRTAKRLYREHDAKRAQCIKLALELRAKASRLRAELARLSADDTLRPEPLGAA